MEAWYQQNRRQTPYWLHVYYLANPRGAKQLFTDTLAELFVEPQNEAQQRLRDLGTAGPGDSEKIAEDRSGEPEWWLLYRACTFLRDDYTLCAVWATEMLIAVLASRNGSSDRRAATDLGVRWRAVTPVERWAGME